MSNDIFGLAEMFRNATEGAESRLWDLAMDVGVSVTTSTFLSDILMGYVLSYLNGATCGKCFTRIGDACDVNDVTICPVCGEEVGVIKITPLRFWLTLNNHVDLFSIIPDKIKSNTNQMAFLKPYADKVLDFYDRVATEDMMEMIVHWLREKRPDLYYTIALFDHPLTTISTQAIYEIDMGNFEQLKSIKESIEDYMGNETSLDPDDPQSFKKWLIEGMERGLDSRVRFYVMEGSEIIATVHTEEEAKSYLKGDRRYFKREGINGYALKEFYNQIDLLKLKMRTVVEEYLEGL